MMTIEDFVIQHESQVRNILKKLDRKRELVAKRAAAIIFKKEIEQELEKLKKSI